MLFRHLGMRKEPLLYQRFALLLNRSVEYQVGTINMATQQEQLLANTLPASLLLLLQAPKCLEVRKQKKQHTRSWGGRGGSRSRAEVLLLQSLLTPLPSSNTESFCLKTVILSSSAGSQLDQSLWYGEESKNDNDPAPLLCSALSILLSAGFKVCKLRWLAN